MNLSDIFTSKVLFSRNIKARSKLFFKKKKKKEEACTKSTFLGELGDKETK